MNTFHIIIAFLIAVLSIFCIEKEINPVTYLAQISGSAYDSFINAEQKWFAYEKNLENRLEGGAEGIN